MIAKGTTHDNGGKLATYLVNAKPGERAELWQLRGFASDQIKDAFRSIHVMADATRCEQPLFHVQVRNPAGECLARQQWERVADRIEGKLGLTDQPRAIAFHRDEATGDEHMHIGWSRIDEMTMTAKALPFFKLRLKEVSRELETELGLTRVRNEREGAVMAPKREEDEQARRLGVDIRDVRATIRKCWEHSDSGRSFAAALANENLMLARGDKRDFIAIDHEGGMHALGKRILGNTAGEVRARMADLDRGQLPTIEQSREHIAAQRAIAAEPAITLGAGRIPESEFGIAAKETMASRLIDSEPITRSQLLTPELSESAADIRRLYLGSRAATDFVTALEREGIRLAVVTRAEAQHSEAYREGQLVGVTARGEVCPLDEHRIGTGAAVLDRFFAGIEKRELLGIEETQQQIDIETRLHIKLGEVGVLQRPAPAPAPETTAEKAGWKRLLRDSAFRGEIEGRRRERQPVKSRDDPGRSRGLER